MASPALINRKVALATTALLASWLGGTAAIDRGLIQEGAGLIAPLTFILAAATWLYASRTLQNVPRLRLAPPILLGWWALNLALCAACGGPIVYRTLFFVASSCATLSLILFSLLHNVLRRDALFTPRILEETRVHS